MIHPEEVRYQALDCNRGPQVDRRTQVDRHHLTSWHCQDVHQTVQEVDAYAESCVFGRDTELALRDGMIHGMKDLSSLEVRKENTGLCVCDETTCGRETSTPGSEFKIFPLYQVTDSNTAAHRQAYDLASTPEDPVIFVRNMHQRTLTQGSM